jgi:hypothetical protein
MIASIQTTIDFDVQHTILTANDQRKMEQHRVGTNALPIKEELDIEVDTFAAISKSIEHFARVIKDAQVYLMDNGAQAPFTLLVTPEAVMDMSYFTRPEAMPQRAIGGTVGNKLDPRGQLGRTDLPTGDFVTPDGTAVFQVRAINFGSKGAPYQMFSRPKLIAEYYHLTWARYRGANLFDGASVGPADQYWSDSRSILVKNETTDQMAKVTMEMCLRNGGRGTNGFPDMEIVKKLAKKSYSPQDFDPAVDPNTGEVRDRTAHNKQRRRAHMMLTLGLPESPRPVRVVHFVGQMDSNVTSAKNVEQMAQTLVAGVSGISNKDIKAAWDLIELMQALDAAPYNRAFFEALITVNSKRNWQPLSGGKHKFVGATNADEDHRKKWNTPKGYVEWRPNDAGFMDLPSWDSSTMGTSMVPPGCANLTGLLALRATKGKGFGYEELAEKADSALSLLARLGERISGSLTSASMDAVNRAPWYLKANPLITMFESCVNVPRDPLFLIAAPFADGEAGDGDYGGKASAPSLSQSLQSVTQVTNISEDDNDAYEKLIAGLQTENGANSANIFVAATSEGPVAGNQIALAGLALSPEVSALRRLGERSAKAYIRLNRNLDVNTRAKLAGLLVAGGTSILSAQQVVLGLQKLIEDGEAEKIIENVAEGNSKALRKAIRTGKAILSTAEPIGPVFTDNGGAAKAVKEVLDKGIDVTSFPASADQAAQFPALGRAVDQILSLIAQIHEERRKTEGEEYNKEEFVYVFPGYEGVEIEADKDVAKAKTNDTEEVKTLLTALTEAGEFYKKIANLLTGAVPKNFGGLGTAALRGVPDPTKKTTVPAGPVDIRFSDAALKGSRYYRSSLVMTPGLKNSLATIPGYPLIRPSDPATGHLEPYAGSGDLPERITGRAQYATVNNRFERTYEHMPWNGHHLDILAHQQSAGARSRSGRRQYADIFAGTGIEEGRSDDIFGDSVESLLSGEPMSIGARDPYASREPYRASFEYDSVSMTNSRGSRPFSEYERAVLEAGDVEDSEAMKTGAWLINNMHLGSMKYHIMEANKIKNNPIVRWAAMAILTSRIDHVEYWIDMVRANVLVPCNVLLMRPAIEFVMDNFVLMKAGSDTGGTLFNHSSAMLGWDVYTRMIYLNYLFYSKAFVWGPENIYVLENIMPRRYIAGCGMNFITDISQLSTAQSQHRHDMLAVILPLEECHFDEVIGILGNRNEVYGDANPEFDGPMDSPQYSSAHYVREMLGGDSSVSISRMLNEHKSKRVEYFETIGTVPPVVFQGYYQSWSGSNFGLVHPGKGHKGEYSDYNGSRRPWNRRGSPYFLQRSDQPFVSNV